MLPWQREGWSWSHHGRIFDGVFRTLGFESVHRFCGVNSNQQQSGILFVPTTAQRRRGFELLSILPDIASFCVTQRHDLRPRSTLLHSTPEYEIYQFDMGVAFFLGRERGPGYLDSLDMDQSIGRSARRRETV